MRIESNAIEPFVIEIDEDQFVLIEKKVIQEGQNSGNIHESTIGYYKSISALIKRVVQIRLARQQTVVNLKTFISKWREMQEEIESEIQL